MPARKGLLARVRPRFLNALSYPIQILVRATPVDPESLRRDSRGGAGRQLSDGQLADLAHDHAAVLCRDSPRPAHAARAPLLTWSCQPETPTLEQVGRPLVPRRQCQARRGATGARLRAASSRSAATTWADNSAGCGLIVRRLADLELAHLYLACWSPEPRPRAALFRQHLDGLQPPCRARHDARAGGGVAAMLGPASPEGAASAH